MYTSIETKYHSMTILFVTIVTSYRLLRTLIVIPRPARKRRRNDIPFYAVRLTKNYTHESSYVISERTGGKIKKKSFKTNFHQKPIKNYNFWFKNIPKAYYYYYYEYYVKLETIYYYTRTCTFYCSIVK